MITRPDPSARNDLRLCCVAVVISYHPPKWCNLRFLRNNPIFAVAGILAAGFFVEYLLRMLVVLFVPVLSATYFKGLFSHVLTHPETLIIFYNSWLTLVFVFLRISYVANVTQKKVFLRNNRTFQCSNQIIQYLSKHTFYLFFIYCIIINSFFSWRRPPTTITPTTAPEGRRRKKSGRITSNSSSNPNI